MSLPGDTSSNTPTSEGRRGWGGAWRAGRRLAVVVVVTYVVVCGAVAIGQKRLIYFPEAEYRAVPSDIGLAYQEVVLSTNDGVKLAAWDVPAGPAGKGTILFCHGNAGNIGDRLLTIQILHNLGYNVLIFDYRGYGRSGGSPSEGGTYRDAEAAWAYLTEVRGERPEGIAIIGRSLGGAVAIELALRHRPGALVVESTFTSLADIARIHYPLLPARLLLVHRYDSIRKVVKLDCPKLFLHGTDDTLIPIDNARRLYAAAREPKRFIETPGDHNSCGFTWGPPYDAELDAFLSQALAGGRP